MIKCLDFLILGSTVSANGMTVRAEGIGQCNAIMTLLQENLEGKSQWHMQQERKIDTILDSTH